MNSAAGSQSKAAPASAGESQSSHVRPKLAPVQIKHRSKSAFPLVRLVCQANYTREHMSLTSHMGNKRTAKTTTVGTADIACNRGGEGLKTWRLSW